MFQKIGSWIKAKPSLKKFIHWMLIPTNEYRPRLWVKLFVNPFVHQRGKGSIIRSQTRIDVIPFNRFYLGANSTIEDYSTINNGVGNIFIGDNTIIGISNVIIGPANIGNNVMIAQNVVISGLNHNFEDVSLPPLLQHFSSKIIVIEDDVWIGGGAIIMPGINIGDDAVIGAGAVVTRDVEPEALAIGRARQENKPGYAPRLRARAQAIKAAKAGKATKVSLDDL